MWDYNKLFADGNIIGVKNCYKNKIFPSSIDDTTSTAWLNAYKNNNLCCKDQYIDVDDVVKHGYTTDFEIQYIVRLDGHGNVVERLFDRERDMKPKPMPKLETGMFVYVPRIGTGLGFVDAENNHIIYQSGNFDYIQDNKLGKGIIAEITKVYDKNTVYSFNLCDECKPIWEKSN